MFCRLCNLDINNKEFQDHLLSNHGLFSCKCGIMAFSKDIMEKHFYRCPFKESIEIENIERLLTMYYENPNRAICFCGFYGEKRRLSDHQKSNESCIAKKCCGSAFSTFNAYMKHICEPHSKDVPNVSTQQEPKRKLPTINQQPKRQKIHSSKACNEVGKSQRQAETENVSDGNIQPVKSRA